MIYLLNLFLSSVMKTASMSVQKTHQLGLYISQVLSRLLHSIEIIEAFGAKNMAVCVITVKRLHISYGIQKYNQLTILNVPDMTHRTVTIIYIYIYIYTGVVICPQVDQEGNKRPNSRFIQHTSTKLNNLLSPFL